jgi:1-acyl-sn-glycerol-3-phosphate acyltransferase
MLNFLPSWIICFFSFSFYFINTIFWLIPIVIFSFLKAIIPVTISRKFFSYLLDQMASNWVAVNTINQKIFYKTNIKVNGLSSLNMKEWYLVLCNHQSWVDIVILQRVLHGKIPFLKFFLKKELIYVPFLGIAWWALDFPFMKRHSQAFLKKNPHLKGEDIKTTRKSCEKFKYKPVSVMSFIEGTRFTPQKHQKQSSPYQYLLKPKAGGIGFVLDAMGEHLTKIVNITIYYPDGIPTFYDFVSGNVKNVRVHIDSTDVDSELKGDYFNDRNFKINFQKHVNTMWERKDATLTMLHEEHKD